VDVVNDPTDHQLIQQIENLKNNGFDLTKGKILADSIYGTNEALEYLEKNGLDAYIPSRKQATLNKKHHDKTSEKYHKYDFFYDFRILLVLWMEKSKIIY
jgi:hypothetical protein